MLCQPDNSENIRKERGMAELRKCILLCKNCHYEEHAALWLRRCAAEYEAGPIGLNGDIPGFPELEGKG